MRHSLLVPQLTLKEATWFAGDHGKGMTEQSSCQAAQSNPHACKQKLNGIISILSSTRSLLLILFLMALCIFTESHLKYFSDVFKILTKAEKKSNPMPVKRTETEVYTEFLPCAKQCWQEAGNLVYGGKSNKVCCVSSTSSTHIQGTL